MKKFVFLLLIPVLLFAGCGSKVTAGTPDLPTEAATAPPATPAPTPSPTPKPTPEPTPSPTTEPTPEPTPPPFAVEHELRLIAPEAYDDQPISMFTDTELVVPVPIVLNVTAPVITRSDIDKDGYATWTVDYDISGTLSFDRDPSAGSYHFGAHFNRYELYDYYTGLAFPDRELDTTREENTTGFDISVPVSYDGREYPVSYTTSTVSDFGEWSYEGRIASISISSHMQIVVTAPSDYDGLLIALDRGEAPNPEDPFSVERGDPDETLTFWDAFDRTDEWVFIRLSDYALPNVP